MKSNECTAGFGRMVGERRTAKTHARHSSRKLRRRGAVLLETLIVLPILLIGVLGIVELSMLTSNLSWVKRASRDAADVAISVPLPVAGPVPVEVEDAVNAALNEKGAIWTEIRVDHWDGIGPPGALVSGAGGCTPPTVLPTRPYVIVTVCVEESQLAPNLLRTMCFDLDGRFVQQTTIRCY